MRVCSLLVANAATRHPSSGSSASRPGPSSRQPPSSTDEGGRRHRPPGITAHRRKTRHVRTANHELSAILRRRRPVRVGRLAQLQPAESSPSCCQKNRSHGPWRSHRWRTTSRRQPPCRPAAGPPASTSSGPALFGQMAGWKAVACQNNIGVHRLPPRICSLQQSRRCIVQKDSDISSTFPADHPIRYAGVVRYAC